MPPTAICLCFTVQTKPGRSPGPEAAATYRLIALLAIVLSLTGLLLAGVGFLFSSVWAWSVVGYAFSQALLGDALAAAKK